MANEIGSYQNERLVSIAQAMKLEQLTYSLESEEKVIFVFPIYAWSPPQLVVDFIKKLSFNGSVPSYLSVVVTCGENIGETERVIQRLFEQNSWALQSFDTLVMPNNYLILGTVDSKEERREKLPFNRNTSRRTYFFTDLTRNTVVIGKEWLNTSAK